MKGYIILLVTSALLISGCVGNDLKDNQVYIVEKGMTNQDGDNYVGFIDTKGINMFHEVSEEILLNEGEILLTISPDGQSYYVMEFTNQYDEYVLKGNPLEKVKITRVDLVDGDRNVIIQEIPLVSEVGWNNAGDIVAFCGGHKITIYDCDEEKLILDYRLDEDPIKDFGWSPTEDNKIYLQSAEGFGSSIYYVDSQKKVELYETTKKIYPRGRLDEQYLYAIQWRSVETESTKQEVLYTVLVDDQGQVIKPIGEGMFKESYGRSVILIGVNGFGLHYINDINQVSKGKQISDQYIYDAKFVHNGNVAYITEDLVEGNNQFLLHVIDGKGKEIINIPISGSSFALTVDGKKGYIGGQNREVIDFTNLSVKRVNSFVPKKVSSNDQQQIIHQLRGAIEVYGKLNVGMAITQENINSYFINTNQPPQQANSDIGEMVNLRYEQQEEQKIKVEAKLNQLNVDSKNGRASANLTVYVSASNNIVIQQNLAWELVKLNNRWYITGLSTFPNTKITKDVQRTVQELLYNDELIYEDIKIDEASIGQIQFWQKEKLSLSMNNEEANLAKIYLETMNGSYVLWLKRVTEDHWQISSIVEG